MKNSPKDCHIDNRWLKFFRKWHRWPGVIMGFFFILWAISGVVMNHRQLFSGLDLSRKLLPKENRYVNWNNAAVKSLVSVGNDSLLVYGNIGAWLTDTSFSSFQNFNLGFPEGIDNRKISSMLVTGRDNIYAGTLFGLFHYDRQARQWKKLGIALKDERIQWLIEKDDKVIILTRSEMLSAPDEPENFLARSLPLPAPEGYDNKAGMFRTIWVIHSGEIYGAAGRLIVDAIGLIVIILALTGALHFAMPYTLRHLKRKKKPLKLASSTKRTSAAWHKKAGIWIAVFVLINTLTGMFLRPPLLIAIADARVGKIPWSVLDTPNPWEDKLRAVIFDEEAGGFLFGTSEGIYFAEESLQNEMVPMPNQPPLSVMGINVFRKTGSGRYLVGSFNGIYDWHPEGDGVPWDSIPSGKPFGDEMISGYWSSGKGKEVIFDYNKGAVSPGSRPGLPEMPEEIIENSPVSWWNFALEVHTGRIFKPLTGDLYILFVPLMGIFGTILVASGIIIWIKLYVRKNR